MAEINFREYITKNNTKVLAGKDAKSNEELVAQVEPEENVLHTAAPGSPFVNIKGKTKKGDLEEAAIFCARYSHDWRNNKKDVVVHNFKGKDIYKEKSMKLGTFGIKKFKIIKVKAKDIINLEETKK
jgi:predicted ribosome quality control (RQC) complex YloA/Tae2 family protein